jgi:uncharacterized membrane protein YjjP (DUF1212 family)
MSLITARHPSSENQDTDASGLRFDEELICELGLALHNVGQPAHRLESTLARVACRLGLVVQSFSLPTGLMLCFKRAGTPATVLVRLSPKPTDLERMRQRTIEAEALARGRIVPRAALERIRGLTGLRPQRSRAATVAGFLLSAAAFSVFFGAGVRELLIATAVGFAVGLVAILFGKSRTSSRRFELTAAAVAGFVSALADAHLGSYVHWIPIASGLVILLPGLTLVDSIEELANGHLASGAARMAGVGVVFLALIFGVLLGVNAAGLIADEGPPGGAIPLPYWVALPALLVVALGSTFRFQARWHDVPWILVASAVALAGSRLGARLGNPLLAPFLGALVLGLAANLYARWKEPTPHLLLVPGLAVLVPGSFGLRSLDSLLSGQAVIGVNEGFQMFMMTMALVAGLLFSNAVVATDANT